MAVMVVPMFSPKIIAVAISKGIHPFEHMMSVMATVALEDCTSSVIMVPIKRKIRIDPKPISVYPRRNSSASG